MFISISACSVLLLIRVLIGKIIDDDFVGNLTFEKGEYDCSFMVCMVVNSYNE